MNTRGGEAFFQENSAHKRENRLYELPTVDPHDRQTHDAKQRPYRKLPTEECRKRSRDHTADDQSEYGGRSASVTKNAAVFTEPIVL